MVFVFVVDPCMAHGVTVTQLVFPHPSLFSKILKILFQKKFLKFCFN